MVKHADSQYRDREFDSSMRHFKNVIGEEGNGKPPHEFDFPRKNLRALSRVSATLEIEYTTEKSVKTLRRTEGLGMSGIAGEG